ncbi:hypothetical protein [Rhizobium sp. MHM7A]|uniref:hypothetical protein n=1 Tax=Rhizobium sp. MHM7A TaxID=2583233 RepID=UPI00110693FA|nr:hypothetical protein [Rhizobium sp. MHM7A]TLX16761.1 hypothetical protein FFR93_05300 [Rhizobium sp. MHM7A]
MTQEEIARMSPEEHLKTLAQANRDYWNFSSQMQSQWGSGRDPGEEADEKLDALWAQMHLLTETALKNNA